MKKAGYIRTDVKGGGSFDDASQYKEGMAPDKVRVWSGSAVDAVQLICGDTELEKHGGKGGGLNEGTLSEGNYIKLMRVTIGMFGGKKVLTALSFFDQDGKKIAGNERPGQVLELRAEEGECICGLFGETVKAGGANVISEIGIYTCKLPGFGDLLGSMQSVFGKLS